MPLILCRQEARTPLRHDKLNINIWSEQELCYIIYTYPLLCLGDFCSERLYDWIDSELMLPGLAERIRQCAKRGEAKANCLLMILSDCCYYDTSEVMAFRQRLTEIIRYTDDERLQAEGKALCLLGSYSLACDKFAEAVKVLETAFRREASSDDQKLRDHNRRKAELYCDMAAARLQLFDEGSAKELLELSSNTYRNSRAEEMRYLIDGSGELDDETKKALDSKKLKVSEAVRGSRAYREILDIFEKDRKTMLAQARKLAAEWKQQYRHL